MARLLALVLAAAVVSRTALAQDAKCSPNSKCPEKAPCCSPYGDCGVGAYCLGGCDPFSSFSAESCVPSPVCKSNTYEWDDVDSIVSREKYLGDASKHDWVASGDPLSSNGNLLLTMGPDTGGTLLAHNHYMWYGKASARMRSSRGKGVVTAFILMSDVKDEIDFEFVGVDLENAQTNYYHQGIIDYTNGDNETVGDTFGEFHTYEIDWKPESITWSIDGESMRVQKREETWNETANRYNYPQTPSRVQLSLWPAGLPSNGEGTIEWAGGLVDWKHPDIQNHGYYYAQVDKITIECYDPPDGASINGDKSYVYTDLKGLESSVEITDEDTVLASLLGNGEDMDKDYPSASGTGGGPQETDINVIPGLHGGGAGTNGQRGRDDSDGSGGSGGGGGYQDGEFCQDCDGDNSTGAAARPEQVFNGSMFAVMVAVLALVTM